MDSEKHSSLPFACSLCGSCTDVCPVKIDLHHQLLTWRGEIAKRNQLPLDKKLGMKLAGIVLGNSWLYRLSGWLARKVVPLLPRWLVYNRLNPWGQQREMPAMPERSFRELLQIRSKYQQPQPPATKNHG
jgi:L-lactate dehydrogenase complex protein LldF